MDLNFKWWQRAVFYQIYPRSFADGNGDGIGDFKGMIDKLDYLQDLGIDAVWLSPHFPSPYVDCGYDISDYENVAPEYGSLKDFKIFLDGLHQRGMRLILDLVLNHTSDQHPWFLESKSSKDNSKRDWYIWKPGKNGKEPNNWYSTFGGSAWEFDKNTDEYYYHFFFKQQPDLNWKNPAVKKAMFDSVRFWLDMGVDGFRLDAIGTIFEDERYLDHSAKFSQSELVVRDYKARTFEEKAQVGKEWEEMFHYQHDLPEVHQVMRELRQLIDEYDDRVLVGETDEIAFYGNGNDELHLNFNFPLMRVDKMTARHVLSNQKERLAKLPVGAWPCNTLGNHDCPRMYSQFGDGIHDDLIARQNLLMLLTLKGTPFLYYGEEIGMTDLYLENVDQFRDTLAIDYFSLVSKLFDVNEQEALQIASRHGRDKCRTPMQWSGAVNGGFSPGDVKTWLPVNANHQFGVNVEDELKTRDSLLNFYRALIRFRKDHIALQIGEIKFAETNPDGVVEFIRRSDQEELLILLNFMDECKQIHVNGYSQVIFEAEREQGKFDGKHVNLVPYAAVIMK